MIVNILLIILCIIVVCGLIRVIITPSESILHFFIDILFIDFLIDLLGALLDAIDFD